MSEHTLLLCPFGHASKAEVVEHPYSPKHRSRNRIQISAIRCLTCNHVLINETHTIDQLDSLEEMVIGRSYVNYFYSEDDTWEGTSLMFVDVPDGAEYTEPVPSGQAYNEMVNAENSVK